MHGRGVGGGGVGFCRAASRRVRSPVRHRPTMSRAPGRGRRIPAAERPATARDTGPGCGLGFDPRQRVTAAHGSLKPSRQLPGPGRLGCARAASRNRQKKAEASNGAKTGQRRGNAWRGAARRQGAREARGIIPKPQLARLARPPGVLGHTSGPGQVRSGAAGLVALGWPGWSSRRRAVGSL